MEWNRGVWEDVGIGPNGEPILVVIDHRLRERARCLVPHDANLAQVIDALVVYLDTVDALPMIAARPSAPRAQQLAGGPHRDARMRIVP